MTRYHEYNNHSIRLSESQEKLIWEMKIKDELERLFSIIEPKTRFDTVQEFEVIHKQIADWVERTEWGIILDYKHNWLDFSSGD